MDRAKTFMLVGLQMPFSVGLAGAIGGHLQGDWRQGAGWGVLLGLAGGAFMLRRANTWVTERAQGISQHLIALMMADNYDAKHSEAILVVDPPKRNLTDHQQLTVQMAQYEFRQPGEELLAMVYSTDPLGTIAVIRKTALQRVQALHLAGQPVLTFADLRRGLATAGYKATQVRTFECEATTLWVGSKSA